MPPELVTKRFKGLKSGLDPDDGDITDLIQAENVQFDSEGVLMARKGFRAWIDNNVDTASAGTRIVFIGFLDPLVELSVETSWLFNVNGQFAAGFGTPNIVNGIALNVMASSTLCRGVQYVDKLYTSDGKNWNGSAMASTPGVPYSQYGPMAVHAERVWHSPKEGAFGYRLYFSDPGVPSNWPAANFIDIGPGTGGILTGLRSFRNRLYIFKTASMWVLDTPGVATTWILRKFSDYGCVGQTVCEYGGLLIWVGRQGVFTYDGIQIEKVSEPIADVFEAGVTDDYDCNGDVFDGDYVFWIRVAGVKRYFCYNIAQGLWSEWTMPMETGTTVVQSIFARAGTRLATRRGLYITANKGDRRGVVYGTDATGGYSDATAVFGTPTVWTEVPYSVTVKTKFHDFKEAFNKKRVIQWLLEVVAGSLSVTQKDEENRSVVQAGLTPTGATGVLRVKGIGFFRRVSLQLVASGIQTSGFRLKGVYARVTLRGQQIKNESEVLT